jgi:SWI/SNF-related matrix-associated actin-dependent regulator of chromatin subfamily A member 5
LLELLQKEEDFKNNKGSEECPHLTLNEDREKYELLKTGFRSWNKNDLQMFVSANEKWGRSNIEEIAKVLDRPVEDVQAYSDVFWSRFRELPGGERFMKFIENGQVK